jgi:hypothetical protein
MYLNHVPTINAAMRECPKTFARGVMFAILSARVQFPRVPIQMKELDRMGARAACLWGWKRGAFDYVTEHRDTLWHETCAARDSEEAILILCRIPGMGIVKAAFVLQFLGHDIACLDTRNIMREGLDPRAYRSDGPACKARPAFARKARRYVTQTQGRAQELWDAWCGDVAGVYGMQAAQISAMHLAIVPARQRHLTSPLVPFIGLSEPIPF